MAALRLHVYLRNDDYVHKLEKDLAQASFNADDWKKRFEALSRKYSDVQHVNMELVDLLRVNGIRFRSAADISKWGK